MDEIIKKDGEGTLVLTEKQNAVYQLVAVGGLSKQEAASKLGVSRQNVSQVLKTVEAKIEQAGEGAKLEIAEHHQGLTTPEVRAFWDAAKLLGLDNNHIQALVRRYEGRVPGADKLGALDDLSLGKLVDERLHLALRYMDPSTMAKSSAAQLAKVIGSLMTVRQLLRGDPTHIVRVEDRRKLGELAEALQAEIRRREQGQIIDVTPEEAA